MSKRPRPEPNHAGPSTPPRAQKDVSFPKKSKPSTDDKRVAQFTAGFASKAASNLPSTPLRKPDTLAGRSKGLLDRNVRDFAQFVASNSRNVDGLPPKPESSLVKKSSMNLLAPSFVFPETPTPSMRRKPVTDPSSLLPERESLASNFDVFRTPKRPLASISSRLEATEPFIREASLYRPTLATPTRTLPAPIPLTDLKTEGESHKNKSTVTPLTTRIMGAITLPLTSPEPTREDEELQRGLGLSPSKSKYRWGSGGGKQSFVRNGLAERASNLILSYQLKITLWQSSITHSKHSSVSVDHKSKSSHPILVHMTDSKTSLRESSIGLKPDIRFLVIHVCGRFGGRGKDVRSFTVALCQVLKQRRDGKHLEETMESKKAQGDLMKTDNTREIGVTVEQSTSRDVKAEGVVIFSSSRKVGIGNVSGVNLMRLDSIQAGVEVLVWQPWHRVSLSTVQGGRRSSDEEDPVMLCSRFAVKAVS